MTTLKKFIQDTINDETLEDKSENEKELKKQLKEKEQIIIKKYPEKILFLDGEWGIGKSYYVKNILETKLALDKKYIPIRISLFGVKSIDELRDKLLNEYIKERNEKISKFFNKKYIRMWFCLIISLSLILLNYLINNFYDISSAIFSYIFSLFTNQYNENTVSYMKVFGDFLNYFHFIPEIYLWILFLYHLPLTGNILSYLDNKYFGTNIALQKVAINKLFLPKRYILIFDDIERVSEDFNLEELFGLLNDLRENKGFNIIVIGNEIELQKNKSYKGKKQNYYEKIEFQKIPFEYTKKRYKNLKEYCLKQNNISGEYKTQLSKYIDNCINNAISDRYSTGGQHINNLRIIKNLIMTIINFKEIVAKKEKINKDENKIKTGISKILAIYLIKKFRVSSSYTPSNFLPFSDRDFDNIAYFIPEIKEEYVEKALK